MLDSLQLPAPTRTLPATPETVTMVPVNRIEVLNSRERNSKIFNDIVENIRAIGLKKPITVTQRPTDDGEPSYLLVCGEGRLNAFRILGQSHIPALVVDVSGTVLSDINGMISAAFTQSWILSPQYLHNIFVIMQHGIRDWLLQRRCRERHPCSARHLGSTVHRIGTAHGGGGPESWGATHKVDGRWLA
jgi:hypothetical protein